MCLDAGGELKQAWAAILRQGGPEKCPAAVALLERLPDRPEPLTWRTAPEVVRNYDRMTYLREWTEFYRRSYREAREAAEAGR